MKFLILFLLLTSPVMSQQSEAQTAPAVPFEPGSSNGPAIDKNSNPVVDPTLNVTNLVKALEKRMEDIRALTDKNLDDRFKYREEITELQSQITEIKTMHNDEIVKLRSDYQIRSDDKESSRIDAIIASDRSAAKNEVDRSQKAVDTVATLQTATAETLRSAVATTAAGIATQFAQTTSALVERIAALEKASYTGQGRSTVADPQVEALKASVDKLISSQAQGSGKSEGIDASWQILLAIAGIGIAVVVMIRKPRQIETRRQNDRNN